LTEEEAREEMRSIVFRLLVIMVSTSFLLFLRGFIFNGAGERVVARLRIRLFKAILSQEIAFFDKNKTGELLSRLSSDTAKVSTFLPLSISVSLSHTHPYRSRTPLHHPSQCSSATVFP
jgi:ABC-type multidrug transport system fused ATPase/permease subunit